MRVVEPRSSSIAVIITALLLTTVLQSPIRDGPPADSSRRPIGQDIGNATVSISPFTSFRFIKGCQNIETNRFSGLDDIYFYLVVMEEAGRLAALDASVVKEIVDTVQGFQNADGGFGDWYRDRSKAGSTMRALETLARLNATPLNASAVREFVGRLQVSGLSYGNFGFRSSVKVRNADISSTYNALRALEILGAPTPNRTGVVAYVKDHQNEDGGFGYQTNRKAGIIWPSTTVHTVRGLRALQVLGEEPDFAAEAVRFVQGLQTTEGGFIDLKGGSARIAYTYNAIVSLELMGETTPRPDDVIDYVLNNQLANGGFIENETDMREGIHTAAYAMASLRMLGATFDAGRIADFADTFLDERLDGGFGDQPDLSSTLRATFHAVSVLNLIGREPLDRDAVIAYIESKRNPDGGYGDNNRSNVESTYRAIMSLVALGHPVEDPTSVAAYIRSSQNDDGGFGFALGYISRGTYTYRAIRALDALGWEPLNAQGAESYLKSLQNVDGGFGNFFDDQSSDLGSTYKAIRCLHILGSSPARADDAEDFILGARNPDGGFRRSPSDTSPPNNFSRSFYTYDAVLALHFLERPISGDASLVSYLEALRNPDLGFASNPFFTSDVESTFLSIWTLFYADPGLNVAPDLTNGTVITTGNASEAATFRVDYIDTDGQYPEIIRLVLDGAIHSMSAASGNRQSMTFELPMIVPVGSHVYSFRATDGLSRAWTGNLSFTVEGEGEPPTLALFVDSPEGTAETLFTFTAFYEDGDGDPAEYVRLSLSGTTVIELVSDDGYRYSAATTLPPGTIEATAMSSDGANVVASNALQVLVHERNSSRPAWDTFLRIRDTLEKGGFGAIEYMDVSLSDHEGNLVWRVATGDGEVLVSHDGTRIIDRPRGGDGPTWTFVLGAFIMGVLAIALGIVLVRSADRSKRGAKGGRR